MSVKTELVAELSECFKQFDAFDFSKRMLIGDIYMAANGVLTQAKDRDDLLDYDVGVTHKNGIDPTDGYEVEIMVQYNNFNNSMDAWIMFVGIHNDISIKEDPIDAYDRAMGIL